MRALISSLTVKPEVTINILTRGIDNLKRSTFNYIKDILKDYPDIENHIKQREEELRRHHQSEDINRNIRGYGAKPNAMDIMLITIEQDRRLAALERNRRVVEDNLSSCDEDTRTIIEELYIKRYQRYTMDGLVEAHLISCGRSKAFDLRDCFFKNIARDLGLEI